MPPLPNDDTARRLDRHDIILEKLTEGQVKLAEGQVRIGLAVESLVKQDAKHDEELKELRADQVNVGRVLEAIKTKFTVLQWFLTSAGAIVIAWGLKFVFK